MRRFQVLVILLFAGLMLTPQALAFYAAAGAGLYGGVGYCPYHPRTAKNAIENENSYKRRKKDLDKVKKEIDRLEKEEREAKKTLQKAERAIEKVLEKKVWGIMKEHYTHPNPISSYNKSCNCPNGGRINNGAVAETRVTNENGGNGGFEGTDEEPELTGNPRKMVGRGGARQKTSPKPSGIILTPKQEAELKLYQDEGNCDGSGWLDSDLSTEGCRAKFNREMIEGNESRVDEPKGFWKSLASALGFGGDDNEKVNSPIAGSNGLNRTPSDITSTPCDLNDGDACDTATSDGGTTDTEVYGDCTGLPVPAPFCDGDDNLWGGLGHSGWAEDDGTFSVEICNSLVKTIVKPSYRKIDNYRMDDNRDDCQEGLEDWYEAKETLEEEKDYLAQLKRDYRSELRQYNHDVDEAAEDLEAECPDGSCFDIHYSKKPTTLETVGNIGTTVLGALMSYKLGNNAIDMNARAGWPTPPAGVASFGYPFMMAGMYGLTAGLTGRGGFGCAGGIGGGGFGMGPYGMAGAYGPMAGMYPQMGGAFGYPQGMFGPQMGGGMYMPGMGPWGMAGPMGAGGMMIGGGFGAMMGGYPMGGMIGGGIGAMMGGMPMGGMMMNGMMMGGYPMGGMMGGMPMGGMIGGGIGAMMGGMPMGGMMGGMPMGGMMGGMPMGGMMGGYPMGGMMGGGIGAMMGGMPMGGMMGSMMGGGQMNMQMQQMYMQQMQQTMAIQAQQQQENMYRQQTVSQLTQELYRIQMQIQQISMGGYGSGFGSSVYGGAGISPTFVPGGAVRPAAGGGAGVSSGGNSAPRR